MLFHTQRGPTKGRLENYGTMDRSQRLSKRRHLFWKPLVANKELLVRQNSGSSKLAIGIGAEKRLVRLIDTLLRAENHEVEKLIIKQFILVGILVSQ